MSFNLFTLPFVNLILITTNKLLSMIILIIKCIIKMMKILVLLLLKLFNPILVKLIIWLIIHPILCFKLLRILINLVNILIWLFSLINKWMYRRMHTYQLSWIFLKLLVLFRFNHFLIINYASILNISILYHFLLILYILIFLQYIFWHNPSLFLITKMLLWHNHSP